MKLLKHTVVSVCTAAILTLGNISFAGFPEGENPARAPSADDYVKDRIIVRFKKDISTTAVDTLLSSLGISREKEFSQLGITSLKINSGVPVLELVNTLNKNDLLVEYAEPDYIYSAFALPNDTSFNSLWGLNNTGQTGGTADADIDAPEAWDITSGSSSVVVAVIDTGIDYTHPDLNDNVWVNPAEIAGNGVDDDGNGYIDDVHGINAITHSGDPLDDNSHGTHVSGTIGAEGNNAEGVTGVNWDVSIMGVKFLDASGSGSTSGAIEALEYVLTMKQAGVNIRVTNNSWGGGAYSEALKTAFDAVGIAGTLHAVAAGNNNSDNDAVPSYPSSYDLDTIISVGATDHTDNRSSFSQWGATSVDLGAPGTAILSTVPGNGYSSFNGTSMATPHVAGAAALLASQFPGMTPVGIKSRLMSTVDTKIQLSGLWASNGRLNIYNALSCVAGNPVLTPSLPDSFVANQNEDILVYASLNDCDPVTGATMSASFSNGDPQISLLDDGIAPDLSAGDGVYTGIWTASGIGATTIQFTSTSPTLTTSVDGTVVERIVYSKNDAYPFNWVDISASGTPLGLSDDSTFYSVPFNFDLYGALHSQVAINSNGTVYFQDTFMSYINSPIPFGGSGATDSVVAVFWDDLNPASGGEIYYEIQGSRLMIQWDNIPHFPNTGAASFQLILDQSNGDILMQYLDVDFGEISYDNGASATVGLQQDSSYGQQHSFNTPVIGNNQAILWSLVNQLPSITSPAPGTTLSASSETFSWSANGAQVDDWWLYLGSAAGAANYYSSGNLGSVTTTTATNLPTDSSTIYARLWYRVSGNWQHIDEQYTAASSVNTPTIDSPVPGSVLSGDSAAFNWQANGTAVDAWWVYAGPIQGNHNYYNSGNLGSATSTTITGLPTDGSVVHIRLFYLVNGVWLFVDEQYTAATAASTPTITSPVPGSVLAGDSEAFNWQSNGTTVEAWWVYAGPTLGSHQYYDSGNLGAATSTVVSVLPTDGSTVYVRLWYKIGGAWQSVDEQYTTAGNPAIVSPVPGSELTGASEVFTWQANGIAVDAWWIYAGATAGSASYYTSGNLGNAASDTVSGLPADGSPVFIRLWYRVGGNWLFVDEMYSASGGA